MERVHITYLLVFLIVLLGSLFGGIFAVQIRRTMQEKRKRLAKLSKDARLISDREKAFQDKYGQ